MSRPKKNTKAGRAATNKWKETMLKKYGSPEAVHAFMQGIGGKGGRNGHTGGFAANPELARKAGAKGGSISRRGPKIEVDKHRATVVQMLADGETVTNIAEETGLPYEVARRLAREVRREIFTDDLNKDEVK